MLKTALLSGSFLAIFCTTVVADGGLTNVQVLPKTTSKQEVKAIMKAQAKSLGVDCDFCHDVPDMASDTNEHKKIARQMMRMTAEINAKWTKSLKDADKNQVTCGTCHRGQKEPPKFVGGE
jgi:cytochrome c556